MDKLVAMTEAFCSVIWELSSRYIVFIWFSYLVGRRRVPGIARANERELRGTNKARSKQEQCREEPPVALCRGRVVIRFSLLLSSLSLSFWLFGQSVHAGDVPVRALSAPVISSPLVSCWWPRRSSTHQFHHHCADRAPSSLFLCPLSIIPHTVSALETPPDSNPSSRLHPTTTSAHPRLSCTAFAFSISGRFLFREDCD